jgi:hypothetical protein
VNSCWCCSGETPVGVQSMALASTSLSAVGGSGAERSEGKPNTGFVGMMMGFVERDKAERGSGSDTDGERYAGVPERDREGVAVAGWK